MSLMKTHVLTLFPVGFKESRSKEVAKNLNFNHCVAQAMGVKVTMISTSPDKKEEAIDNLGADSFLVNCDQNQM
uniref:Uncharacterized protein n=1 Tax=Cannabis sativa TaxID=3483 RepID=A0A803NPJ1_CANSA